MAPHPRGAGSESPSAHSDSEKSGSPETPYADIEKDVNVSALPALSLTGALANPASQSNSRVGAGEDGEQQLADDSASESSVYIPQKYRWIAFSMIIFFATGSSFAEGTLGPLKSTLVKQLKINNAQYGAIASADNLINTILPIIGGIGIDYWGATYAAILSSSFILLGNIIASTSAHTGQYQLLIAGRIIAGLGSTVIEGTQNKLFAHWFSGSYIAFIFALDIAWNRVTSIFSRAASVPMSQINGFWGWALWIPTIACAVNLGLCLAYWGYERSVPRQYRPKLGRQARKKEGWDKRKFVFGYITHLPKFFWILCGTQLFQNAAVSVYSSNLADVQTVTRGTSTLAAGYNSSIQGVIPILLTPVVGAFFDRYGWRMAFVSWTAALYIVVFVLIAFTKVHPLAPILVSSFALTSNALTFIASIPVLVGDDQYLGTAFGIWKAFQNCNTTILEVAAGAIQDRTPGQTYERVFYLLIAIKSIEVLCGPAYDYLDGQWLNHSLRKPEQVRLQIRKQAKAEVPGDLEGWRVSRTVLYIVGGQLTCMIIVAWVVYIVYSLGA